MAQDGWFIAKNEVVSGPYTDDSLKKEILSGNINENCLIWREGQANWQTITSSKIWQNLGKASTAAPIEQSRKEIKDNPNDPRRAKRIPIVTSVTALDGTSVKNFPCMDISETGIFLISENLSLYKLSTRLILKVGKSNDIPDGFQISGEVVRISDKWPKGYAIKFINMNIENAKMLKNILKRKGG